MIRPWNGRRGRDSAVGIATGYAPDDRGVRVRVQVGSRIFSSPSYRLALGLTQPPIQWVPGALSSGVKRPGREAKHSPPTCARSRKCGTIHTLPHTPSWRSAKLVKHRDSFTFFYLLPWSGRLRDQERCGMRRKCKGKQNAEVGGGTEEEDKVLYKLQ
jgi:hypothetical protein